MPHDYTPHDSGEPRQITPEGPADVFETMARAMFNAGLSWKVVQNKWPGLCDAFEGFAPSAVAGFDGERIAAILARSDVISSSAKVTGVVENAKTFLALTEAHGSVLAWLREMEDYWAREKALKKRFKWIGDFGAYWMLYTLGEPVPHYAEWCRIKGKPVPAGLSSPSE